MEFYLSIYIYTYVYMYIWEFHSPNDELIFFRGVGIPPTSQVQKKEQVSCQQCFRQRPVANGINIEAVAGYCLIFQHFPIRLSCWKCRPWANPDIVSLVMYPVMPKIVSIEWWVLYLQPPLHPIVSHYFSLYPIISLIIFPIHHILVLMVIHPVCLSKASWLMVSHHPKDAWVFAIHITHMYQLYDSPYLYLDIIGIP